MKHLQYKLDSKIGALYLVTSEKGLRGIFWKKQNLPMAENLKGISSETRIMNTTVKELTEYLDGKRQKFEVPLDFEGTDFQKKVWKVLREIPYGKTLSYKQVADKIGTNAIRAVGTANGKNPLCIVVPCHRVIASSGGLGGYSGGIQIKQYLLDLERAL